MQFSKKQYSNIIKAVVFISLFILIVLVGVDFTFDDNITVSNISEYKHIKITSADTDINYTDATLINLSDVNNSLTISESGKYIISGELSGNLNINAEDQMVHIMLDNVVIDSNGGPAINVISAGKVIITLAENSINSLSDSASYSNKEIADACIYSDCDLTINGEGILSVYGYYKDAIHSKDILKILGGEMYIKSKRDGIHGNDGIVISCSKTDIQSERSGLHSTKYGKETKGNIEIFNGEHSIIAGKYAISCMADLYINECQLYCTSVISNINVNGSTFISEGSLLNA